MRIESNRNKNVQVITISGKFDISAVPNFDSHIALQIHSSPAAIAIKMRDLNYIDSSAIGSLIRHMNELSARKIELICFDLHENIQEIFRLSRLHAYIRIMTDEEFQSYLSAQ